METCFIRDGEEIKKLKSLSRNENADYYYRIDLYDKNLMFQNIYAAF